METQAQAKQLLKPRLRLVTICCLPGLSDLFGEKRETTKKLIEL